MNCADVGYKLAISYAHLEDAWLTVCYHALLLVQFTPFCDHLFLFLTSTAKPAWKADLLFPLLRHTFCSKNH